MARKTNGFTDWVGKQRERWGSFWNKNKTNGTPQSIPQPHNAPNNLPPGPVRPLTLKERMEQRFEQLMQEVDDLSNNKSTVEEHAEYGWIVMIRFTLPLLFFTLFGYEDGLFMTGFQYFSWVPFIMLMYGIGYGLEGLRVAMVYSMGFSKAEGRKKAWKQQFIFWIIMSLGCGVAQLASALVIQALGTDASVTGSSAVAHGASVIMGRMPSLIYFAIGIRVALCAVADWACSGFLHKRKQTIEQKVSGIMTRAENFSTLLQSQNTAQTIVSNAQHYEEVIADERSDLKALRAQQKKLTDLAFSAGMRQIRQIVEEERRDVPELEAPDEEE
jgi:hypothetical protein